MFCTSYPLCMLVLDYQVLHARQLDYFFNKQINLRTNQDTSKEPETSVLESSRRQIKFCRVYICWDPFFHMIRDQKWITQNIYSRFEFSLPRAFYTWSRICHSHFDFLEIVVCLCLLGVQSSCSPTKTISFGRTASRSGRPDRFKN